MKLILDHIARAVFQSMAPPSEEQIMSELRQAFGLKRNVEYSIIDNNVAVKGDTEGIEFKVDGGNLYNKGTDDEFKVENNNLYVKE